MEIWSFLDRIKRDFFKAMNVSVLQYGYNTLTVNKIMEEKTT